MVSSWVITDLPALEPIIFLRIDGTDFKIRDLRLLGVNPISDPSTV
jgi:hypothetical protein